MLNKVAAHLPGSVSAKQALAQLRRQGILVDEVAQRRRARAAEERSRLTAAYQRHRLQPDFLQHIAGDMPGVVTPAQVSPRPSE